MLVVLVVIIVCVIVLQEKSGHLPDGWGTVIEGSLFQCVISVD